MKERPWSLKTKMGMFDGIMVPVVMYGCKAWTLDKAVKDMMNV